MARESLYREDRRSFTLSGVPGADDERPIDLHVHTTASDGTLSPSECVDMAAHNAIAAIGITDHDTVDGNAEALARGAEVGVEVVPAVEIAAAHEHWTLHILGYYPEPGDTGLADLLACLRSGRDERNPQILARLAELDRPISDEDLAAESDTGVLGRSHIAAAMVRRGYVRNHQDAFDRYLGRGAAAYVERGKPTAADGIAALLAAKAVPVLAHPGMLGIYDAKSLDAVVAPLVEMGLGGIEAYYHAHTPSQTAMCQRVADKHGILITGGSDFHGAGKPDIKMGTGRGRMHVPYRLLTRLKQARQRV